MLTALLYPIDTISPAHALAMVAIAAVTYPLVLCLLLWWELYRLNTSIAELVKIFSFDELGRRSKLQLTEFGCSICHHKHTTSEPCFTGPEVRQNECSDPVCACHLGPMYPGFRHRGERAAL